jgi:hypothetical protein
MSLVLDRDGLLYNYDISNNKTSGVIDCDFAAKKIINRFRSSYVSSTDGQLYIIRVEPVTIFKIPLNFFVVDFMYEYNRDKFYLLSNDNTLYIMLIPCFTIIKMKNHKIIKMTNLSTNYTGSNYYACVSLFITNSHTIMYCNRDNIFVELDLITYEDMENAPPFGTLVSTCSIKENLLFFTNKLNFQHSNMLYYYDPNRLAYVPSPPYIAPSISITKYFKFYNYMLVYDIYVDNDNNKYLYSNINFVQKIEKLPLLVNYDVNFPKITNTKNSRNVVI